MKKLITSLLAAFMCLGVFCNVGSLSISAEEITPHENPIIETREVDWPDYNYGGWQDTVKDPSKKAKVTQCLISKLGSVVKKWGVEAAYSMLLTGGLDAIGVSLTQAIPFITCLAS